MIKYIVEFVLIDGDSIEEDWNSEKDIKEFNIQIAQLMIRSPWYTIIGDKAININVSKIKYFTINKV